MTTDVTGRVLCDWIENDPDARSKGRICYHVRTVVEGWVKVGKKDFCPKHAYVATWAT